MVHPKLLNVSKSYSGSGSAPRVLTEALFLADEVVMMSSPRYERREELIAFPELQTSQRGDESQRTQEAA
jgi:hypothetical protein